MRPILSTLLMLLFGACALMAQPSATDPCATIFTLEQFLPDSVTSQQKTNTEVHIANDTLLYSFLAARSYYPELDDLVISVRYKPMKNSTMMAQPSFNIFRSKENRVYNIFVNEAITNNGISYKDLTFNALVGWYGHEIAHLTDYKHRSLLGMAVYGIWYSLSRKFMKKIEFQTDSITIAHGLGCQLLEGVEFCLSSEKISPSYKQKLIRYYMLPEQIRATLNSSQRARVTPE